VFFDNYSVTITNVVTDMYPDTELLDLFNSAILGLVLMATAVRSLRVVGR
jgi:hypothetical protein